MRVYKHPTQPRFIVAKEGNRSVEIERTQLPANANEARMILASLLVPPFPPPEFPTIPDPIPDDELDDPEIARLTNDKTVWLAKNWANKTPTEIQTLVEQRINSISTLAQAKSILLELLPIMGWAISALAHQTLER